jgi:hyperosmotically inducible protein
MDTPIDDVQLRERIERAIQRDGRLSSQPIEVAVSAGRVRLAGTVQSYRRRLAALEIAASFEGCRDVADDLSVQPALVPDAEIAESVRASLNASADLTKDTITVNARNGIVTLTGHLGDPQERRIAQDIALGVRGVRAVNNQITVDLSQQERDDALANELRQMLRQTRGLADADDRLAVNSAAIVLSGTVPNLADKVMAESVAARFMPGLLRNEIKVNG